MNVIFFERIMEDSKQLKKIIASRPFFIIKNIYVEGLYSIYKYLICL